MANASHASLAKSALRLIEKNGRNLILSSAPTVASIEPPDATKPWKIAGTPARTETEVKAAFTRYNQFNTPKTDVAATDERVLMPATDIAGAAIAPKMGDTLIDESDNHWAIMSVQPIKPGSIPILFIVQARQGGVTP